MDLKLSKSVSGMIPRPLVNFLEQLEHPHDLLMKTVTFLVLKFVIFTECLCHPKKLTRGRRNIPGSDLESSRSILLSSKKICMVRTHPEELHASEVGHKRLL